VIRRLSVAAIGVPIGSHSSQTYALFALSSVVEIVTSMLGAVGTAAIYFELRLVKEGAAPEQLAAVFA
jgi:hypothetical protein